MLRTVTIQNTSDKRLVLMQDSVQYFLEPKQLWTLEWDMGQWFLRKWFKQLEAVDQGKPLTVPPTIDPDLHTPPPVFKRAAPKVWCQTCGKADFISTAQLAMHQKKHEKEDRLAKEQADKLALAEAAT